MPTRSGRRFREGVYAVVRRIPPGRVMAYGQIALVLGAPRAARAVGGALHLLAGESTDVPWWRVVNARGTISTRCPAHSMWEQAARLRAEGVAVDATLHLDLARYQWWPDRAALRALGLAPELVAALEAYLRRPHRAAPPPAPMGSDYTGGRAGRHEHTGDGP
ncbi:MAG TPA: MGMT family protein [Chloroflexota bacterium]|nr:MGMT family protein [Chloroflexota bacterium]